MTIKSCLWIDTRLRLCVFMCAWEGGWQCFCRQLTNPLKSPLKVCVVTGHKTACCLSSTSRMLGISWVEWRRHWQVKCGGYVKKGQGSWSYPDRQDPSSDPPVIEETTVANHWAGTWLYATILITYLIFSEGLNSRISFDLQPRVRKSYILRSETSSSESRPEHTT